MSGEILLDFARGERIGLHEAVLCMNKSAAQLQAVLDELQARGHDMLFTRLDAAVHAQLRIASGRLDYDAVSRTAIFRAVGEAEGESAGAGSPRIAVLSAGTSDVPVAREALRTLAFHGETALAIHDVGVSGLWRLQRHLPELGDKRALICVAGMDAALPTVLAGLVPGLVIAVPTSTGYGTARGGETALNALLCSCAQGLVVVNIDNGFGAACAALRALRLPV